MADEIENESLDSPDLKGISTVTGQETAESLPPTNPTQDIVTTDIPESNGNGDDDKKKKKKNQTKDTSKGKSATSFNPSDLYIEPTTEIDKTLSEISSRISSPSAPEAIGTDYTFDKDAFEVYKGQFTPIDLSNAIPDPVEREAYKDEHKDRIVDLLDPKAIGIRFENQVQDLANFRQKGYEKNLKLFLDELDENQAWYETSWNNLWKLPAKLATGVGSLIPLAYGMGKALVNMDSKYIFENGGFDALESIDSYIDKKLVVYGGYDYTQGDKPFYARFMDNPGKMINNDVVPILGFVGSAVLTEMVAGALAPVTGGTSLLANSARISAQASRTFGKGVRLARGMDVLSDIKKAEQLASLTSKFKVGYGTAAQMLRSSGYESALIARDTQRSTVNKSKINYINSNPKLKAQYEKLLVSNSDEFGNLLVDMDTILSQVNIPNSVVNRINRAGDQAGKLSYWSNVPLVGASNLVQFSKTFNTSYRIGQKLSSTGFKINPLRGVKFTTEAGKRTAKAAAKTASKFEKVIGWGMVGGKGFITEAGEEFSQGVFEKGYSDYFSAPFTDSSVKRTKDFLTTMTNSARNYYNSVEGQDSIWLGGLAGMFGIPLYIRTNTETGKLERGWQWYGGAYEEIKETKERIAQDKIAAEYYNANPINPIAKNNFENYIREQQFQEEANTALEKGNRFEYENARHKSTFSLVNNRIKNGIEDTLFEDLDVLDKMDLKTFNDNFAFKGYEYTKESKRDAIDDSRQRIKRVIKASEKVNNIFADKQVAVDRLFNKEFKEAQDPYNLLEGVKDQLKFLYSSVIDYKQREDSLSKKVSELTSGLINPKQFDKILAKYSGTKVEYHTVKKGETAESIAKKYYQSLGLTKEDIGPVKEGDKVRLDSGQTFVNNAREFYNETLAEFKQENPIDYATNEVELKEILKDLIDIKLKKAKAAEAYSTLFKNKGMVNFGNMYLELIERKSKEVNKLIQEENKTKVEKAKGPAAVTKSELDTSNKETGNPIVTAKVNEEVDKIIQDVELLRKNNEDITADYVIEQLQKSPGFSLQVLQALEEDSLGATSIDELEEFIFSGEYPKLEGQLKNIFNKLLNQYSAVNQSNSSTSNVSQEPSPTDEEAQSLASKYSLKVAKQSDARIFDSMPVTPVSIMLNSQHKKLSKNNVTGIYEPVRDSYGSFENGTYANTKGNKNSGKQNVDIKLLLSPEFLNNKMLQEENVQVTFRQSETNNYAEQDPNQRVIEVLYEDKVVGELPGWENGRPLQLKNLREALSKQFADESVEGEVSGFIGYKSTIVASSKTLTKEVYDNFIDTGEVPVTVLKSIAEKIKKGEQLNDMELAVSQEFAQDIEDILKADKTKETTTLETEIEAKKKQLGIEKVVNIYPPYTRGLSQDNFEFDVKREDGTIMRLTALPGGPKYPLLFRATIKNNKGTWAQTINGKKAVPKNVEVTKNINEYLPKELVSLLEGTLSIQEQFEKTDEFKSFTEDTPQSERTQKRLDFEKSLLDTLKPYTDLFQKNILEAELKSEQKSLDIYKARKETELNNKKITRQEARVKKIQEQIAALETTTLEANAKIDNKIIADFLIGGEFYYYRTDSDSAKPIRITTENVQEAIERNEVGDNIVDEKELAVGKLPAIIIVEDIEFRGIQELRDALDKYKEDYTKEELNAIKQEFEKLTALETTTQDIEAQKADVEKRRQRDLNSIKNLSRSTGVSYNGYLLKGERFEGSSPNATLVENGFFADTKKEAIDLINAKYDAELAALETTTPEAEMSEAEEMYVGIQDIMMELEPGTKEWDDTINEMAELEKIIVKEREEKGREDVNEKIRFKKDVKIRKQSTQEEINESKEVVKKLLEDIDQAVEAGQRPNRDLIGAIFTAKLVQVRNYNTSVLEKMIANKKEKIKAAEAAKNANINASGKTKQINANLISLIPVLNKELKALESLLAEGVTPSEAALETTSPETEVEQTAREKVIEENFEDIIKALTANPIMQGDAFIGKEKC